MKLISGKKIDCRNINIKIWLYIQLFTYLQVIPVDIRSTKVISQHLCDSRNLCWSNFFHITSNPCTYPHNLIHFTVFDQLSSLINISTKTRAFSLTLLAMLLVSNRAAAVTGCIDVFTYMASYMLYTLIYIHICICL